MYVLRRLVAWTLVLIGAIFVAFMVLYYIGTPRFVPFGQDTAQWAIDAWYEMFGLNDPALTQFFRYIAGVFSGDLGISFRRNVSVVNEVMPRFAYTFWIGALAFLSSFILATFIGILSVIKKGYLTDKLVKTITNLGISMPITWLSLLVVVANGGPFNRPMSGEPPNVFYIAILPIIALGISMFFIMIDAVRVSMLGAGNPNYIQTAYTKGLSKAKVVLKHTFKNALVSILSTIRKHLGTFFTGLIIVEQIFFSPGIGRLLIQSVLSGDYPMVLGCILLFILFYTTLNLLIDITQAFIDPRVMITTKH